MTPQDITILALTAWRENRGGQPQPEAMQSVCNVVMNRVAKQGTDAWTECTRHMQFSSITAPGDPELALWPSDSDPQWGTALGLAEAAANGSLVDLTGGADLYYAPTSIKTAASITLPNGTTIPFPQGWNPAAVTYKATIADQVFFKST